MSPPEIPLELLLEIANNLRDSHGELRYGDLNSFAQVILTVHDDGMQPFR
jgi:hypothetical protein